jgi:hypothetical protein
MGLLLAVLADFEPREDSESAVLRVSTRSRKLVLSMRHIIINILLLWKGEDRQRKKRN